MQTFNYQNYDIKYIKTGKGKPAVFIHNGGTSHVIWDSVIDELSDKYTCYSLDLLGYGSSYKPKSEMPIELHLDILSAFIEEHQLKDVTLVGNCMGSALSLAYTQQNPKNVHTLILFNPLTYHTFEKGNLGSFLKMRKVAPGLSKTIYKGLGKMKLNNLISEQSLRMQFGPIGRAQHLEKTEDLCACFTGEGQMNSLLLTLDDLVNYDQFDKINTAGNFPPICTIWGDDNLILSSKAGRKLNKTLQPQREEWLKGGGHLVMMELPAASANIIQDFIEQNS
ncbi:MAG: alpha/beta hydrolase [Chitinophagales bacterium]|nr:alpha/beta hydrolase [Chitinophagales bacterium]